MPGATLRGKKKNTNPRFKQVKHFAATHSWGKLRETTYNFKRLEFLNGYDTLAYKFPHSLLFTLWVNLIKHAHNKIRVKMYNNYHLTPFCKLYINLGKYSSINNSRALSLDNIKARAILFRMYTVFTFCITMRRLCWRWRGFTARILKQRVKSAWYKNMKEISLLSRCLHIYYTQCQDKRILLFSNISTLAIILIMRKYCWRIHKEIHAHN